MVGSEKEGKSFPSPPSRWQNKKKKKEEENDVL